MRARQILETRRWEAMANERNFGNVNELCAIGFSAARSGNAALAEMARQGLATRATSPQEGDLRPAIAIMERQVAALIALAAERGDEAVDILRAADARRAAAAAAARVCRSRSSRRRSCSARCCSKSGGPRRRSRRFGQALARNANRTRSVLGTARAASALGQTDAAREHYQRVLADHDRPTPRTEEVRRGPSGAGRPCPCPAPAGRVQRGAVWRPVHAIASLAGSPVSSRSPACCSPFVIGKAGRRHRGASSAPPRRPATQARQEVGRRQPNLGRPEAARFASSCWGAPAPSP